MDEAETNTNDNWLGSWLSAAKDKSSKVLEFVKKDLEEFGNAVKTEASNVVSTTGNVFERTFKLDSPNSTAGTMKRSFSSFLGQMNTVLNPSPDDSDTEAILIGENSETVTLSKLQRAIYELQKNDKTFIDDPDDTLTDKFNCWLDIIDDQLSDERINKQLNSSYLLRSQYSKFVPDSVRHDLFWKRYLFKKALLEDEIAHLEAMEQRDKKEKLQNNENNLKWEQEEFAHYIDLTEDEQIKLLEEYESEMKTKKLNVINKNDEILKSSHSITKNINQNNTKSADTSKIIKNEQPPPAGIDTPSSNSSTDGDWEKISDIEK